MVGTTGAVAALDSGRRAEIEEVLCTARGTSGSADTSSLSSTTFQSFLNETIGRPGASDTAVGVGSLGLRSLSLNPVAARSSSLRISLPSFMGTSGSFSVFAFTSAAGLELLEFKV